jgi:hypothetical protein
MFLQVRYGKPLANALKKIYKKERKTERAQTDEKNCT